MAAEYSKRKRERERERERESTHGHLGKKSILQDVH